MKIFFIVLALLLVLFAVGIGLGARGDGDAGKPVDPKDFGWLDALTRPLRPTVETGAFQGSCVSGRTAELGAMTPCGIAIAPADEEVRTLELALEQGGAVEAGFQPRGGGLNVHSTLRAGREVRLSVPRDGAELTLVCLGSEGCRVRLD